MQNKLKLRKRTFRLIFTEQTSKEESTDDPAPFNEEMRC